MIFKIFKRINQDIMILKTLWLPTWQKVLKVRNGLLSTGHEEKPGSWHPQNPLLNHVRIKRPE